MSENPYDRSTPLLIVGAPRSGTTLIRNVVRLCEGVYLPPDETQFLPAYFGLDSALSAQGRLKFINQTPFASNMRERKLWPPDEELLKALKSHDATIAVPELMFTLAQYEGLKNVCLWGDKTPSYIFHLDLFESLFPKYRALLVIRDPRDTVLSMRDAWGRSLLRGALVWRDAVRQILKREHSQRHLEVRYESFVGAPEQEMNRIASWIGHEFDDHALSTYVGEERWGSARGAGIQSTTVGRFRHYLTPRQIMTIEQIVFPEMLALGYEPDYAKCQVEPKRISVATARIFDSLSSVIRYTSDRGIASAIRYKARQSSLKKRGPHH